MLVLTRRVDEAVAIGDSIVVTVLAIEGDRVKIGISAPREIPILRLNRLKDFVPQDRNFARHEVFQAVEAQAALQNRLAGQPEPSSFEQLRRLLEENASTPDSPPQEGGAEPKA